MPDTRDRHAAVPTTPLALVEEIQSSYAPNVVWDAPRRGVTWLGRQKVVENLLREAAAMQGLEITRLRCSCTDVQVIDEFVARFRYSGEGIDNVPLPAGATVELERLRILTLANKQVTLETSIETWTVLEPGPATAPPPPAPAAAAPPSGDAS